MDVWVPTVDETSGKTYYYNCISKEVRWTKPGPMGLQPGDTTDPKISWVQANDPDTKENRMLAKDTTDPQKSWVQATDPDTGKAYWYNSETNESTWEKPSSYIMEKPSSIPSPRPPPRRKSTKLPPKVGSYAANTSVANSALSVSQEEKSPQQQIAEKQQTAEDTANSSDSDDDGHFTFAQHRHGWFNRTFHTGEVFEDTKLLTFKKSMIKKALLKKNRDLDEEAIQCFKNVMSYMGDRKSSKGDVAHARKLLHNLMIAPAGLRDEVYMQLCKQTTGNSKPLSCVKGWELMVFCLATFPPSKHLKVFLKKYFDHTVVGCENEDIVKLAKDCAERLPTIVAMGQRKQVPTHIELEHLKECTQVPIKVSLIDGSFKTLLVGPYDLCENIQRQLVERYNLTCHEPFALYEQAGDNVERILDPADRMLDVMASWENGPIMEEVKEKEQKNVRYRNRDKVDREMEQASKKIEVKRIEYNSFLYKAKLALKICHESLKEDPEALHLLYIQAAHELLTDRYPCNKKDIASMVALQLQATYGDFNSCIHIAGWLEPKLTQYVPKHLLMKKDKIQSNLLKEWEVQILTKYQMVGGFTTLDAKVNYLDYIGRWTFYGVTFYTVEQRQLKKCPSTIKLGINTEGIIIVHPETRAILEQYPYTDIVTWGHSDCKFIVVVGNIIQQRKFIFKTLEGKHMASLIHDYVNFVVKSKVEKRRESLKVKF